MCFITYYDLRAAMMAKDTLDGTEVWGRRIDVHYSCVALLTPRADRAACRKPRTWPDAATATRTRAPSS